jgi:hypothetical protein
MNRLEELNSMVHEDRHVIAWHAPDLADKLPAQWSADDVKRWHAIMRAQASLEKRRFASEMKLLSLAEQRGFGKRTCDRYGGRLDFRNIGDFIGKEIDAFNREFRGRPHFSDTYVLPEDLDRWPPLSMSRHLDDLAKGLRESVPQLIALKPDAWAERRALDLAGQLFRSFPGSVALVECESDGTIHTGRLRQVAYARTQQIFADEQLRVDQAWLAHLVGRLMTGYSVQPW